MPVPPRHLINQAMMQVTDFEVKSKSSAFSPLPALTISSVLVAFFILAFNDIGIVAARSGRLSVESA